MQDLIIGYDHCAERLRISSTVIEKESVSIANSLLIVAIEEVVKGTVYLTYPILKKLVELEIIGIDLDKIGRFMTDHKTKSEIGFIISLLPHFNQIVFKALLQLVKIMKGEQPIKYEIDHSQIVDDRINDWFKQSSTKREKGFYVSLTPQGWITPDALNQRDYLESIEIYEKLKRTADIALKEITQVKDWTKLGFN